MTLRAGEMRHRLAFYTVAATSDEYGESGESQTLYATVWAKVRLNPQIESEGVRDARTQVLEAEIRFREDLTQDMVAVLDGAKTYDVTGLADEDGRRESLIVRGVWRG